MTIVPDTQLTAHVAAPELLADLTLEAGGAGLMLGRNRQNAPVTVRLFRPEPTSAVLVGGLRCAQLLALRAIAVGASVAIQSARPAAWESFARAVRTGIGFLPPDAPVRPPATAARPQLIVIDTGPTVGENALQAAGSWRATLTVRDELTAWDVDALVRADLVVLQPLTEVEGALAASALGLSEVQEWLSRIRADMVTLISRGMLRWALLSPTTLERQIIGPPSRF